jgi:hypothetical protein
MLVTSHFSLEEITSDGYSALHLTAILGRTEIMSIILDYLKEEQFKKKYVKKLINQIN